MASLPNLRGLLLEEAVLYLLSRTVYKTVFEKGTDPTLGNNSAGLTVRGRGSIHQIDAIADSLIHHPFSYPQRLLVEAKCLALKTPVGLDVVRGAVGVLKDVSEYWVKIAGAVAQQRYHYQYAVFSATGYTKETQKYAFAHDIYLIPLAASQFFQPVIEAIRRVEWVTPAGRETDELSVRTKVLRHYVRARLHEHILPQDPAPDNLARYLGGLERFFIACRRVGFALLAVLGARFPVFLVPAPHVHIQGLREQYSVRIFRGGTDETWFLRDRNTSRDLFSFELPRELFIQYAKHGMLSAQAALDLKEAALADFQAFVVRNERMRIIRFRLDRDWLARLRNRI
jgi:hypothetical protein